MPGNGRIPLTLVRAPSATQVPVSDGQVILRPDTGAVEADIGSARVRLTGVEGVDELPGQPLDRIYLCRGQFWAHDGTDWVKLGGGTVSYKVADSKRVVIRQEDGDFQMLHITQDTEIVPPAKIDGYGREIKVEVTDTHMFSFTIAQETFGGSEYVGAILSNSWLVTFHKGYGDVIRWRVEPLRPNTFVVT